MTNSTGKIPKTIHYCWFGNNKLPEVAINCIESWKKFCPDYEIKEWNEKNFDIKCCDYVWEAYKSHKWAFVSDFARLKIIYDHGGIYLDTDVELIKNIDALLLHGCFLGEETTGYIATGLGFGAVKNHFLIGEMLKEYNSHFIIDNNIFDLTPCPKRNTRPLKKYGYVFSGEREYIFKDVCIYPPEYFCPQEYMTGKMKITENTYSIHHYTELWKTKGLTELEKKISKMEKQNNRIVAFVKKHRMYYRFYKKQKNYHSILGYIFDKIREKKAYYKMNSK